MIEGRRKRENDGGRKEGRGRMMEGGRRERENDGGRKEGEGE